MKQHHAWPLPWFPNWVWPMFSEAILNLQKSKKVCVAFKIGHGVARLEKMPNCNKLEIFFLFFLGPNHKLNNNNFSCLECKHFIFHMCVSGGQKIIPNNKHGPCHNALSHSWMFRQGIKFEKKILSYPQPLNKFYTSSCATSHHIYKQAQTNKILLPTNFGKPYLIPSFWQFFL